MIAKVVIGKGFRGASEYLLQQEKGALIGGNMAGITPRQLAHEFGGLRKLRPTLGRAVAHFSLSLPPDDRKPDDTEWRAIANRFIDDMGFADCPFIIVRHDQTEHHHIHILASRINLSGEVVTDKNDFRRAEEIVRCIEVEHGFQAVAASPKKPKIKRGDTMNNNIPSSAMPEPHDAPADTATDAFKTLIAADTTSCHAGDQPNDKKRREMRRAIRDPNYDQMVANIIGPAFKHVYHHQTGAVIYTTDGGRIHDYGDRLTVAHMDNKMAAQRMIALAVARGWTAIVFTGSNDFIREAMQEAVAQGLPVRPKDAMQQAILQEIMDDNYGAAGVAAIPDEVMPEEPEPQPDADYEPPLLDIAARLKRRRELLATPPKPRDPRGPSFR